MKPSIGGIEAAIFVLCLGLTSDVLFRAIPGLDSLSVGAAGGIRLSLFALASLALGFWLQRRYDLPLAIASASFAIGVVASFALRIMRNQMMDAIETEDYGFMIGLAIANWFVISMGAAAGRKRSTN